MSALAESTELVCAAMQKADIDEVIAIERHVYSHPWTPGNFEDSLNSAYYARLLRDAAGHLLGYFLVMPVPVVDEAHLLNLSVDVHAQHQGYGQRLMHEAVALARQQHLKTMLLEVRVSNRQALAFYSRFGFSEIGRRKNYYPVADNRREDALMMTMPL
ncbi:MAG TPA: ribosomal protein S18-alanine N-acetyltransferase [Herbaspirillum sp.]|jgi:ribosomal-protein-alanine N-acetyltransferase